MQKGGNRSLLCLKPLGHTTENLLWPFLHTFYQQWHLLFHNNHHHHFQRVFKVQCLHHQARHCPGRSALIRRMQFQNKRCQKLLLFSRYKQRNHLRHYHMRQSGVVNLLQNHFPQFHQLHLLLLLYLLLLLLSHKFMYHITCNHANLTSEQMKLQQI